MVTNYTALSQINVTDCFGNEDPVKDQYAFDCRTPTPERLVAIRTKGVAGGCLTAI